MVCISFFFLPFELVAGLGIGAWKAGGFSVPSHPVCGPFILQALWREGCGGCRSQGCHGYPTLSVQLHSWLHPPCWHHSPSSSIVDELKCG